MFYNGINIIKLKKQNFRQMQIKLTDTALLIKLNSSGYISGKKSVNALSHRSAK